MSEATRGGITKVHMTDQDGVSIAGGSGGGPASIADGLDIAEGTTTDAVWSGSGAGTVVAILKKIATSGAAAGLTDTQLRASPVPVSGTFWQATQPVSIAGSVPVTGTFWQATQPVSNVFDLAGGAAVTIATQPVAMIGARTAGATATALQAMADNVDAIAVSGIGNSLRVGSLSYMFNGTSWDRIRGDTTSGLKVQGAFFQATQPVSIAATVAVSGPLTDTQLRASAVPVSLTSTTITGTVTTDVSDRAARLLGIVDKGKIWDGTNIAAVKAASTTPVAADPALVVGLHPNSNPTKVWDGSNTAAVKAASTAAAAADPALVVSLSPNSPATTELSTGLTTFCNTNLLATKTAVKASAGKVFGWMIHNPSAATVYIQVWNVAIASITVGTTAPTWVIPLPAGASANVFNDKGVTHSTEINIAATTTATGLTAPATGAVVSIFYV